MDRILNITAIAIALFAGPAMAADRTVTLAVENMSCAACPVIVKGALKGVAGVRSADASVPHKTAVVTFDDEVTDIASLIKATTNAGFPSTLKEE